MHGVTGTFRNGHVELSESVDWPDGTRLEVVPVGTGDTPRGNGPTGKFRHHRRLLTQTISPLVTAKAAIRLHSHVYDGDSSGRKYRGR